MGQQYQEKRGRGCQGIVARRALRSCVAYRASRRTAGVSQWLTAGLAKCDRLERHHQRYTTDVGVLGWSAEKAASTGAPRLLSATHAALRAANHAGRNRRH